MLNVYPTAEPQAAVGVASQIRMRLTRTLFVRELYGTATNSSLICALSAPCITTRKLDWPWIQPQAALENAASTDCRGKHLSARIVVGSISAHDQDSAHELEQVLSLQYDSHAVSRRYSRDLGTNFDNMTPEPKNEYLVSASATKQTMISNKVIIASARNLVR